MVTEAIVEFYWLLEVFPKQGSAEARPQYANKLCDGLTKDAHLAHWFDAGERDVAMEIAARLPLPEGYEFRFTEHGFTQ